MNAFLSRIPVPTMVSSTFIAQLFPNPSPSELMLLANFGLRLNQGKKSIALDMVVGKKIVDTYWAKGYPNRPAPETVDYHSFQLNDPANASEQLHEKPCDRNGLDRIFLTARKTNWTWH
jgi:hypothetical protein